MLPTWLPWHIGITAVIYIAEFFVCGQEIISTNGNVFEVLARLFVFVGCDLPIWASMFMFLFTGFIWLLVGVMMLMPLFNNAITGVIAGIALLTGALVVLMAIIF